MQKLKELKIGDKIINKKSGISCIIIKVNEKTIIGKTGRFEITLTISEFIKDWKKN
jgi:preprotein translocase subunit YajC